MLFITENDAYYCSVFILRCYITMHKVVVVVAVADHTPHSRRHDGASDVFLALTGMAYGMTKMTLHRLATLSAANITIFGLAAAEGRGILESSGAPLGSEL